MSGATLQKQWTILHSFATLVPTNSLIGGDYSMKSRQSNKSTTSKREKLVRAKLKDMQTKKDVTGGHSCGKNGCSGKGMFNVKSNQ
jgi:hypothetical protein